MVENKPKPPYPIALGKIVVCVYLETH